MILIVNIQVIISMQVVLYFIKIQTYVGTIIIVTNKMYSEI